MYLHLGQNEMVPMGSIIGIFDLDNASSSKMTRAFLAEAEKNRVVLDVCEDIPKSFVVADHPYHKQIIYLSQLSSATLQKRAESERFEL